MKHYIYPLVTAIAFTLMAPANAMTKGEFQTASDRLVLDRKTAYEKCEPLARSAKTACVIEAKGQYDIAQLDLASKYKPSSKADLKVRTKRADVAYEIAKARCDDLTGNPKDVCRKDAKAAYVSAKADAKVSMVAAQTSSKDVKKVAEARKDAAEDKSDALYAAAKERCDAMSGEAKTTCANDAKVKFGK